MAEGVTENEWRKEGHLKVQEKENEWRKEGHLKVQEKGWFGREKIKMRWCVVKKNIFRICKNSKEDKLMEEVRLNCCEFHSPEKDAEKESNEKIFQLISSEKKTLTFIASSEDYPQWKDAIIRGKMCMTLQCVKEYRENDSVRRIVLLGKTGNGKSATGNCILGYEKFPSALRNVSVTKQCSRVGEKRFGISLEIVDTPGLYDTELSNEKTIEEIKKCILLSAPGPHAFLLVLKATSRFTEEEENAINKFVSHFGETIYQYFIVVFTGKDQMDAEKLTTARFLEEIPENLKQLLTKCNHRCFFFNNKDNDGNKAKQVLELINVIHNNLKYNNRSYYSNEDYVKATKALLKRAEEIRKEKEGKEQREIDRISKKIDEKMKKRMDDRDASDKQKEEQIKKLQEEKEALLQKVREKEESCNPIDIAKKEVEEGENQSVLSVIFSNVEKVGHYVVTTLVNAGQEVIQNPERLFSFLGWGS